MLTNSSHDKLLHNLRIARDKKRGNNLFEERLLSLRTASVRQCSNMFQAKFASLLRTEQGLSRVVSRDRVGS
jgi:hypothetical protein